LEGTFQIRSATRGINDKGEGHLQRLIMTGTRVMEAIKWEGAILKRQRKKQRESM